MQNLILANANDFEVSLVIFSLATPFNDKPDMRGIKALESEHGSLINKLGAVATCKVFRCDVESKQHVGEFTFW